MCTYLFAGIYCKLKKKTLRASRYIKNKGEQSISNEKDAMKRVYLNLVWSFSSDYK